MNEHLSNDLLVRAMDDELTGTEALQVERHLGSCGVCRGRQAELRQVSDGFESFLQSLQVREFADAGIDGRVQLSRQLEKAALTTTPVRSSSMLLRFGLGMAAAAALAVGISYSSFNGSEHASRQSKTPVSTTEMASIGPFEVNGESFVYLPYSNPDLPLGGSHVVQMEVPLSSLADAGVMVAPVASRIAQPDQAVLADVLLGIDGQPIGVHVLSSD
jgi:hypothetical protein